MPVKIATIPAPVGGWNARDPVEKMATTEARELVNLIPNLSTVDLRKGTRIHQTLAYAVKTIAEHVSEAGTRKILCGANGNLYDVTAYDGTPSSKGSGYTTDFWQTINFGGRLILCNGVDQPLQYDGTTVSNAAYTGVADDAKLINVGVYKQRLFFCEATTASVWYGGVQEITGVLTELDMSYFLTKGGYIRYAGTWGGENTNGPRDMLVIVSSEGEIIIYENFPADETFGIAGKFFIGKPLGYRCFANVGGDLFILASDGVHSLSRLVQANASVSDFANVSDKITNAFSDAVAAYGSNVNWQLIYDQQSRLLIANIPIASNTNAEQFCCMVDNGSWFKLTGWNALCFGQANNKLYWGGTGNIYECFVTQNDGGAAIDYEAQTAFFDYKDQSNKHFSLVRPLLRANKRIMAFVDIATDYSPFQTLGTGITRGETGTSWGSPWGSAWSLIAGEVSNDDWWAVNAIGRTGSIVFKGSNTGIDMTVAGFNIAYEQGGFF